MSKKIFYNSVLLLLVVTGCKNSSTLSYPGKAKNCQGNSLNASLVKVNAINADNIVIDISIHNLCADTFYIVPGYTTTQFLFTGKSMEVGTKVQGATIYPSIDWSKSTKNVKQSYMASRCHPLIDQYSPIAVPPGGSKIMSYDLKAMGYGGFEKNKKYEFSFALDASEQLKSYCPFIWTGFYRSGKYNFTLE